MKTQVQKNNEAEDLQFGYSQESILEPMIQKKFGADLIKTPDRYALYDFTNENCCVELKSRRCNSYDYPDTMIGLNKLEYAREHLNKKIIFCFSFNDGVYYHIYDNNKHYRVNKNGSTRVGKFKLYAYIKKEDLIKI